MGKKNNILRFKEHRKSAHCARGKNDQPFISSFFGGVAVNQRAKPKISNPACPGLKAHNHSRIPYYLSRTVMSHGGARHRSAIEKSILAAHPNHRYRKRTDKQIYGLIMAAERAESGWSNDHIVGAVFSTVCDKEGQVVKGVIIPCLSCRKVLKLKVFKNALRHPVPDVGKYKYTPRAFRNELLGKAYSRHNDVQELMEMVSFIFKVYLMMLISNI